MELGVQLSSVQDRISSVLLGPYPAERDLELSDFGTSPPARSPARRIGRLRVGTWNSVKPCGARIALKR